MHGKIHATAVITINDSGGSSVGGLNSGRHPKAPANFPFSCPKNAKEAMYLVERCSVCMSRERMHCSFTPKQIVEDDIETKRKEEESTGNPEGPHDKQGIVRGNW